VWRAAISDKVSVTATALAYAVQWACFGESMLVQERPYTIVAAVADDDTDTCTLYEALRSAQRAGPAELHLVHVVAAATVRPNADGLTSLDERLASVQEELRRRLEVMELQSPAKITAHFRVGRPSDCILQVAGELDADLLIVGTHKRRGVERVLFGSVAEYVTQRAHCPVLVAMPKDHPPLREPNIDAACDDCLAVRQSSTNQVLWCSRHSRAGLQMHLYVPSDNNVAAYIR
jgi:nucleotide-binding universal stress UspA family protein